MAGLFDLIKGLNTGISSGVGAVASAPKKVVQATASPQGKQVIANLTKIALEKKRKEDEAKAKVQAVINAQIQAKKLQDQTVSAPTNAPIDLPRTGLASLETRFDPIHKLATNIGDGYNQVRPAIVGLATNAISPVSGLLNNLGIKNGLNEFTKNTVDSTLKQVFENPVQAFSDNTLVLRNKFQRGNKNFGDVANSIAGNVANTGGLAMSAMPFIAGQNVAIGALKGNDLTRGVGETAEAIQGLPIQGLNWLASKLPISDELKQLAVMGAGLLLAKTGSKAGEWAGKRIDAGNLGKAVDATGKALTDNKATMFSGIDPTPFLKGVKEFAKNPVVQALDPTGITTGLGATTKATAPVDPLIAEAKKYKSAEEFINSQVNGYHGTAKAFDEFDANKRTIQQGESSKAGFYFNKDSKEAQVFAREASHTLKTGTKGEVMPVKLEYQNPKYLPEGQSTAKIDRVLQAKSEGYDAVIDDSGNIVVFDTSQIKTTTQLTDIYNKAKNTGGEPKTARVWVKSKFSDKGGYVDIPVVRKEENITLYQGGKTGDGRQFWTPDRKYAEQFGDVREKTGDFYKIDNGNRVTNVYVEVPKNSGGELPTKVIAYTGRAKKVDDFGKTRADNLFFSKNPDVAEYYGGTKDNVTRAEIDTEGFADLSNDKKIYKYVGEKFDNSDIDKIYGEPKIPSRYTPEVQQKMESEYYANKRTLLQSQQFAGGKAQEVLLAKLKSEGYKGATLADNAMGKKGTTPDTSFVVFDKSRARVVGGEPPVPPVPPKATAQPKPIPEYQTVKPPVLETTGTLPGGEPLIGNVKTNAGLPEPVFAGNVKMKNIGSSDDARALINLGAQRLKAEGGDGYKEVVPLAQVKQETKDLSERTGINKATLEQWAKESVENRVRITAAREAMSSYAEDVAALSMKSRNEPTNIALKQELADKVRSMQEIQAATSTIIAESGRTLGANRIKTLEGDAIRIQEYIKKNQGKDPGAIADFLQSVPAKDLPKAIKKLTVPSFLDRIMTVRQAALLTDPRTSARNILGNMLGSGLRVVQKPFDIIADKIISGFNKSETSRSLTELLPGNKYKKMISKETMNKYLEKYASKSGKFDNTTLKKTFIEKGADKVFEFLEAQDKIFKRMIGKDSIVASARTQVASEKLTGKAYTARMEELVKNPTDDMLLEMANEATKWTYQNKPNSRVYDTVAGIRNKIPVVGKLAVPFLRTVWNLGSMAIERTVPGQALNLYKLTQGKISGKQALSSLLLTVAIQGAVSAAVESGNVTGTERDPKKRAIREAEGIKDDVINTPFGSFSYKNLEPVSSIIGTAVDVQNTAKSVLSGEKNVVSGAGSVGFSMADRFVNNSFLRGIKDLLDLAPEYQDFSGRNAEERSVNNLGDYGKQQLATFYPRAFNWLEEITNEARAQRPEGFLENLMASTPGLSKGVASKVDIWGQDVKKQDVTGNSSINTVLAALVPVQIEKQKNDPVNKEILRLKYYPSVPTQTIDGVSLSNKEYETYAREAGTMAKARLDMLIKDPIYQRKSDADKIRAIESTIADSRKEAKKSLGNLLDAGQRENLKGKNAKEIEDAAKKVFKEELSPPPRPKTANEIKSGARTAATTAAKGAQKVQSINNMIDAITEQLPQRTEQEILNTIRSKAGGKFSEEEILFAIDMAKTGQKMSTTVPQDATQEYLQKNLPK